jgi:uncharacterized protein (DUF697 family)
MAKLTEEGLAGIRLLVCMARADGVMKADERYAIEDALAGAALPDGLTLDGLLYEQHDPLTLAKKITAQDVREYTYASVFSIAYCDSELADAENALLKLLRTEWKIPAGDEAALRKALDIGSNPANPDENLPQTARSMEQRKQEFDAMLHRTAVLTALTGAIPVPLVPDLLVVPMQVKLVYDVAALFGKREDKKTIQLLIEALLAGTGARVGISSLCKLVPGFGSVVGAASSFASTYALGKVAYLYFEKDATMPVEELKEKYREEQAQGRMEFQKHKGAISEAALTHKLRLKELAYELQNGQITQKEYEKQIDALK